MRAMRTCRAAWSIGGCGLVVLGLMVATGLLAVAAATGQREGVPQKAFATPQEATKALGAAYKKGDRKTMAAILGDKGWQLVFSGDPVLDRYERAWFLSL